MNGLKLLDVISPIQRVIKTAITPIYINVFPRLNGTNIFWFLLFTFSKKIGRKDRKQARINTKERCDENRYSLDEKENIFLKKVKA